MAKTFFFAVMFTGAKSTNTAKPGALKNRTSVRRFYDPMTGEFLTVDPKGYWNHGQGNGKSAFDEDPWNNQDPTGLDPEGGSFSFVDALLNMMKGYFNGQAQLAEYSYGQVGPGMEDAQARIACGNQPLQHWNQTGNARARNEVRRQPIALIEYGGLLFSGGTKNALDLSEQWLRRTLLRFKRVSVRGPLTPSPVWNPPPRAGPPRSLDANGRWHDSAGRFTSEHWPANQGFEFSTDFRLRPDNLVDRHGSPGGSHMSPYFTPYNAHGIPPGMSPHRMREFDVYAGPSVPWYGRSSDIQYMSGVRVHELVDSGYLLELTD